MATLNVKLPVKQSLETFRHQLYPAFTNKAVDGGGNPVEVSWSTFFQETVINENVSSLIATQLLNPTLMLNARNELGVLSPGSSYESDPLLTSILGNAETLAILKQVLNNPQLRTELSELISAPAFPSFLSSFRSELDSLPPLFPGDEEFYNGDTSSSISSSFLSSSEPILIDSQDVSAPVSQGSSFLSSPYVAPSMTEASTIQTPDFTSLENVPFDPSPSPPDQKKRRISDVESSWRKSYSDSQEKSQKEKAG